MSKPVVAYVLATVQTGLEYDVVERVKRIEGVKEVTITYGMWDLVIKVEVENLGELDKVIFTIRNEEGVKRTTTLIGV